MAEIEDETPSASPAEPEATPTAARDAAAQPPVPVQAAVTLPQAAAPAQAEAPAEAAAVQAQEAAPQSQEATVDVAQAAPQPPAAAPKLPEPTLAETAAALAELFPALFTPGEPRPIKLRVQADIQQRAPGAFTKKQLSLFLHRHTTSTAYIRALVSLAQRFDLDGQPAGEAAPEHIEAAKAELERRRQIVMQRRGAARPRAAAAQRGPAEGAGPALDPGADPGLGSGTGGQAAPLPAARPPRPPRSAQVPQPAGGPRRHEPARGPQRPHREGPAGRMPPRSQVAPGARDVPFATDVPHAHDAPNAPGELHSRRPPRQSHPPRQPHPQRPPQGDTQWTQTRPPLPPAQPEDPARRERASLLRNFEGSPLTAANFCALKGLAMPEFEAQIALAREERDKAGKPPPNRPRS